LGGNFSDTEGGIIWQPALAASIASDWSENSMQ
jgi:hypothetical protein